MHVGWLKKYDGLRGRSYLYKLNFLWKSGEIYIMDNHKMALWCWLQHIKKSEKYDFLHIDRHYDTAPRYIKSTNEPTLDIATMSWSEYDELKEQGNPETPYFNWSDYVFWFHKLYTDLIEKNFYAVHKSDMPGAPPPLSMKYQELSEPPQLASDLRHIFKISNRQWIINLDLDYFFKDTAGEEGNDVGAQYQRYADGIIDEIFTILAAQLKSGKIAVLTVALSPECAGGWNSATQICEKFCSRAGIKFKLGE